MIHQHAIVDAEAKIGKDVEIGPYSVIGTHVEIGDGCKIGPHVVINGPTKIGINNKIYQFASLGEAPQHNGYNNEPTVLEIGDNNIIREYVTLNRGSPSGHGVTKIGNDNFLMAYVHVAHDCIVGNNTIFANCTNLGGHVEVHDFAILGGFTGVHQFCRIGAHCMTAVGAVCFKDLPTFFLASGNPATPRGINSEGLKRRNFTIKCLDAIKFAYKTLYRSKKSYKEALAILQEQAATSVEVGQLVDFLKNSERGIIR